jgi:hypothetical protein
MQSRSVPVGMVIAERQFCLHDQAGTERWVTVRLGSPIRVSLDVPETETTFLEVSVTNPGTRS